MREKFRRLLHEVDEALFPSSLYCVLCGAMIDRSRSYSLCDDCIGKFHWITGRTCAGCGKAMPDTSRGRLCYDCMREEHIFRKGFSCLTYGLHERELMMDLKYAGRGYLARIFGDVMFDRLEVEIREGIFAPGGPGDLGTGVDPGDPAEPGASSGTRVPLEPGAPAGSGASAGPGAEEHVRIDLIAPVPVSRGRLRKRGYNQSAIMARQLAIRWQACVREAEAAAEGRPAGAEATAAGRSAGTGQTLQGAGLYPAPKCRSNLLVRTRETGMLRSLGPAERRMTLQDVFRVRPAEEAGLAEKRVLLIDDIYTTGATADACSQALLDGGAREVYLLTLASGGNRRPEG